MGKFSETLPQMGSVARVVLLRQNGEDGTALPLDEGTFTIGKLVTHFLAGFPPHNFHSCAALLNAEGKTHTLKSSSLASKNSRPSLPSDLPGEERVTEQKRVSSVLIPCLNKLSSCVFFRPANPQHLH